MRVFKIVVNEPYDILTYLTKEYLVLLEDNSDEMEAIHKLRESTEELGRIDYVTEVKPNNGVIYIRGYHG